MGNTYESSGAVGPTWMFGGRLPLAREMGDEEVLEVRATGCTMMGEAVLGSIALWNRSGVPDSLMVFGDLFGD